MIDLLSENLDHWIQSEPSPPTSEQDSVSQSSSGNIRQHAHFTFASCVASCSLVVSKTVIADHGAEMRYEFSSLLIHAEVIQDHQNDFFTTRQYISQPPTPTMRMHGMYNIYILSDRHKCGYFWNYNSRFSGIESSFTWPRQSINYNVLLAYILREVT
jgi:hypothetical protein